MATEGATACASGKAARRTHWCIVPVNKPMCRSTSRSTTWVLNDNHLDHLAMVCKPPAKLLLHEFFPETAEFKEHMLRVGKEHKRLAEIVAGFEEKKHEREVEDKEHTIEGKTEVLQVVAQKRKHHNLEKARESLKANKAAPMASRVAIFTAGDLSVALRPCLCVTRRRRRRKALCLQCCWHLGF